MGVEVVGRPPSIPTFRFDQGTPMLVWTIVHNLGYKPAGIYVEDGAGTKHDPWIEYLDNNTVRLTFVGAIDGFALLS